MKDPLLKEFAEIRCIGDRLLVLCETKEERNERWYKEQGWSSGFAMPDMHANHNQRYGRYGRVLDMGEGVREDLTFGMQVVFPRHAGLKISDESRVINIGENEILGIVNES